MNDSVHLKKYSKSTSRGRQTLFRVTYRTQLNLIRIADNKANMIMGINAMIITILIGILSSQMMFSSEGVTSNPMLMVPIVLIMLTATLTAVFAIRAARPRLVKSDNTNRADSLQGSYLFFENIWKMSGKEYMSKMEELINSSQDMYENMIIDIYNQAKVLHGKYRSLSIAYLIFLIGYIVSIASFLFLWMFNLRL